MDKNTYETYEFLPATSNEADTDQFVVVHDDGTFLLNRQIQYVAQVQNAKEVLEEVQPCTVYGVSPQQFFVDVDNPGELISVTDPFILPEGENSLYTNSYLLQPSSSSATEQMDEDVVVDQFKQQSTQDVDVDVVTHNSKQGNNFTEITLSDEQYHTLEQKGWILLESNDKIFVLDTLGLHDITNNDKLVQKLRNEIHNGTSEGIKPENVTSPFTNIVTDTEPLSDPQETVNFIISNDKGDNIESVQFVVGDKENGPEWNSSEADPEIETEAGPRKLLFDGAKEIQLNETNSIKIKTKFNFKDIPDKIFLGKSVNGKRLVAKVTRPVNNKKEDAGKDVADPQNNSSGLSEGEFTTLIQQTLQAGAYIMLNEEDLTSAEMVIAQLLKSGNIKQALAGQNLVVTKVTNNKNECGVVYNNSKPSIVTGRVLEKPSSSCFEHLPNLLQNIKTKSEEKNNARSKEAHRGNEEEAKENIALFHIHILETKCSDNVVRVSVTLKKRHILEEIFLEKSANNGSGANTEKKHLNETITYRDLADSQNCPNGLNEFEFIGLMQQKLQAGANNTVVDEDIASAEMVISQLMKVPNLKYALEGCNLVVTKASNTKDEFGVIYNRSKATFVTGRVTEKNGAFEHVPNLLQNIKARSEQQNITRSNVTYSCVEEKEAKETITLFHVHITETKCTDNIVRVSVTLKKRQLPVNFLFTTKKRYPTPVFACSGCAALFKSEDTLKEHQESHCHMDTDDMLTIETESTSKSDDDMLIIKKGKDKIYTCTQCDSTFSKLSNMQRHKKTHRRVVINTKEETSPDGSTKEQTHKIYKCKMCPSTYYHSASLSKHIVTRHIKIKSN
ncbi:unnamed protein product [Chrysodeixis includens]|uniref:C2H2-type domain-containing protein n=1 Tax=Chrysodeixis includens TaxID=689277 RepID=A0A9N8KU73_CHRIL|nr:unnamed protein product [Chrysodeixis includens]